MWKSRFSSRVPAEGVLEEGAHAGANAPYMIAKARPPKLLLLESRYAVL